MQLMDSVTNETPNFLDTKPKDHDKEKIANKNMLFRVLFV